MRHVSTMFYKLIGFSCLSLFVFQSVYAQASKKASEVTSVAAVNALLGTKLTYEPNSLVNKSSVYECRYIDPKQPGMFFSVGLLNAKIEYGYDLQKTDFDTNKKAITAGQKAIGKFTKFYPVAIAGPTAYYMTGEKDNYTPEAFSFRFRKGDYIVTFQTNAIPTKLMADKVSDLYKLVGKL